MSSSVPAVLTSFLIGAANTWSKLSSRLLYPDPGALQSQTLLSTLLHSHSQIQVTEVSRDPHPFVLLSTRLDYLRFNPAYFQVWVIRVHK